MSAIGSKADVLRTSAEVRVCEGFRMVRRETGKE